MSFSVEKEIIPVILSDRSSALSCAEGERRVSPQNARRFFTSFRMTVPENNPVINWKKYKFN